MRVGVIENTPTLIHLSIYRGGKAAFARASINIQLACFIDNSSF
jgi:hypothetical protein